MKNRHFLVSSMLMVFLLMAFGPPPSVQAQQPWKFALGVGGLMEVSGGQDLKSGNGFGLGILYHPARKLALFMDVYRIRGDVVARADRYSDGTYTYIPVHAGIKWFILLTEKTLPFLEMGVVYSSYSIRVADDLRNQWDILGFQLKESVKSGIGGFLGLGIQQRLSGRFSVSIESRYRLGGPNKGSWEISDKFSDVSTSGELSGVSTPKLDLRIQILFTF